MEIRLQRDGEQDAVRDVVAAAFGEHGPHVLDFLDALLEAAAGRDAPAGDGRGWFRSVVAVDGDRVVGHVGLSPQWLVTADRQRLDVGCLAPLSVVPDRQRQGVGRALVAALAEQTRALGLPAMVLEGDPAVYARYGLRPAADLGWTPSSPLIPAPAQQVLAFADDLPAGRLMYPEPVWWAGASGLSAGVWLDELSRQAGTIASAALAPGVTSSPAMPGAPGWDVDTLLDHLGTVYRIVASWVTDNGRPRLAPLRAQVAPGVDAWHWMVDGWHALHAVLVTRAEDEPASTWCAYDTTAGFWHRRMVHETAIHAVDAVAAGAASSTWVAAGGGRWRVPAEVAVDGVAEALQLWLGTMLGSSVGGAGERITIAPDGERPWTVALHGGVVEVHRLGGDADAQVAGPADVVYRWLWGRAGDGEVDVTGDASSVRSLRAALARAMQ